MKVKIHCELENISIAYEKSSLVLRNLCLLMSPFAPHICEEIWSKFGESDSISNQDFPIHDESYLIEDKFEYPISFNGKLRFKMIFKLDCEYSDIEKELSQNEKVNSLHMFRKNSFSIIPQFLRVP